MIRRKALRERFGEASFGRRKARINTDEIKSNLEFLQKISTLNEQVNSVTKKFDNQIESILTEGLAEPKSARTNMPVDGSPRTFIKH